MTEFQESALKMCGADNLEQLRPSEERLSAAAGKVEKYLTEHYAGVKFTLRQVLDPSPLRPEYVFTLETEEKPGELFSVVLDGEKVLDGYQEYLSCADRRTQVDAALDGLGLEHRTLIEQRLGMGPVARILLDGAALARQAQAIETALRATGFEARFVLYPWVDDLPERADEAITYLKNTPISGIVMFEVRGEE